MVTCADHAEFEPGSPVRPPPEAPEPASAPKPRTRRRPSKAEEAWWLEVDRLYRQADADCKGHLLNPRAKVMGTDPRSLFSGNEGTARRWASDELIDWWREHPRPKRVEWMKGYRERRSEQRSAAA